MRRNSMAAGNSFPCQFHAPNLVPQTRLTHQALFPNGFHWFRTTQKNLAKTVSRGGKQVPSTFSRADKSPQTISACQIISLNNIHRQSPTQKQSRKQSRGGKQSPRTISRAETVSANNLHPPNHVPQQSPQTIAPEQTIPKTISRSRTISQNNLPPRNNLREQSTPAKPCPRRVSTLNLSGQNSLPKQNRTRKQSPITISRRAALADAVS